MSSEDDDLLHPDRQYVFMGRTETEACITWAKALKSKEVQTIEDPLLGTPVDKAAYARIYGMSDRVFL
jgi:hypothetical protein